MKARQPPAPPSPTKDPTTRLLDATLEEIERHGLARLTVRAVASAAGVNIAAVNYYFRSKDALVAAALKGSIDHVAEDAEPLLVRMMGDEPEPALAELLLYLFEGSLRFPQIAKAHLHEAFVEDEYGGPFPRLFATILARTKAAIRKAVPGLGDEEAGARVVAAFSGMFFPAFFRGFFAPIDPLRTPEERAAYAREAARRALAPVAPIAPASASSSASPKRRKR